MTESTEQLVIVQTVRDHQQVFGVGCVLANAVGKWFVTTPARVSIRKSVSPLRVDCRKDGVGGAEENIASKVNGSLWGNVIFTAGVGYLIDRNTGAGFDYPSTLTIELQGNADAASPPAPGGSSTLY